MGADKNANALNWVWAYAIAVTPAILLGGFLYQQGNAHTVASLAATAFALAAAQAVYVAGLWRWITARFGWTSLTTYLLVTAPGALVCGALFTRDGAWSLAAAMAGGAQATLIAWFIRRPDLDQSSVGASNDTSA